MGDDDRIDSERVLGTRPSKTARAMFEAKMRRITALSPRDRMKLALRLGRQLRDLKAAPNR